MRILAQAVVNVQVLHPTEGQHICFSHELEFVSDWTRYTGSCVCACMRESVHTITLPTASGHAHLLQRVYGVQPLRSLWLQSSCVEHSLNRIVCSMQKTMF